MPDRYEDIWTAAKGMYKVEPVVADGGEVVIYAPRITEFSHAYGKELAEVGYHVRDYFTKQWPRLRRYPGTVLAHSTHLKGAGIYHAETDREILRVRVTLATGISEERCRAHNVGYLDPDTVNPSDRHGAAEDGTLVVSDAGEVLFRLAEGTREETGRGNP